MRYRPACAYIDLNALQHNLRVIKSKAPEAKILAVVKANGYGHGINRVVRHLSQADGFGVASLDEAMVLRQQGFLHRILLLEGLFSEAELPLVAQNRLDIVVHSLYQLEWLLDFHCDCKLNVWIKIDSGMHRLGFSKEEFPQVLEQLEAVSDRYRLFTISHFSCADEDTLEAQEFTHKQLETFYDLTDPLSYPKSIANSAGIIYYPQSHFDWVRPGIMLYGAGADPQDNLQLKPVMRLESKLQALRWVKAGEPVGYGNCWTASRKSLIGVVAIGYGDGYPRHARNGTPVLINNRRVPLVGRVSMDMITVDLTDIEGEFNIGDTAVLWGDEQLSVDEVAEYSGTIGYELLCGITKRVTKIER
ncbi:MULTISPECIES: alanine racemase [Thiomicrorhabdus]|uniref:Alanine racemase n=1 Tax=Thiomicrorhabdus heinhorstiae TaxID=2748010 RepID=A0ABS0BY70_9GAMM|nr:MULTISPECIES: alanine racemase [Thiomicrorhabdus]MBF6056896.1 alanine racemase [Thiomicrorhabdus heinhorstiae]